MLHHIASQIGQTENDNGQTSAAVLSYIEAAGIAPDAAPQDWSGALLAWSAVRSGLVPPVGSASPLAWLTWGGALSAPQPGAVVVLTDGGGKSRFMAGVAARVQARKVYVVGGFDGQVQTRAFPIEQVIAARRPPSGTGIASPVSITIEHEAVPPSVITQQGPAVVEALPAVIPQTQPPVPAPQPVSEMGPRVEPQHLEALLSLVQHQFAHLEARIDTVSKTALADVNLKEAS